MGKKENIIPVSAAVNTEEQWLGLRDLQVSEHLLKYLLKAVWVLKSKVIDQKSTYPKEATVEGQSWQTGFFQIGSER